MGQDAKVQRRANRAPASSELAFEWGEEDGGREKIRAVVCARDKIKQGGSWGSWGDLSWQVRQAWMRRMGKLRGDEK